MRADRLSCFIHGNVSKKSERSYFAPLVQSSFLPNFSKSHSTSKQRCLKAIRNQRIFFRKI